MILEPEISEERVRLEAGDSLVLYTDGVVEASPTDEALAPERLAMLLRRAGRPRRGRHRRGDRDAALAVQDGRLRDDVAVVVLRVRPGGVEAPFDAVGAGVAGPA